MISPLDTQLVQIVEIDLDFCSRTYGSAPCAAALGSTGAAKCFNTRNTCQDAANYNAGVQTLRFITNVEKMPTTAFYFPFLKSVSTTPSRLAYGGPKPDNSPFGERASVKATFTDGQWTDQFVDKYYTERFSGVAGSPQYNPVETGTFWGKLRARNLYYFGRPMRVITGVVSDTGELDSTKLTTRHYIIEKIDGPDRNGNVTITGKDPLKTIDSERALCPFPTDTRLAEVLTDTETSSFDVTKESGTMSSEYSAGGWQVTFDGTYDVIACVNRELIRYLGYSDGPPQTIQSLTRGLYNSAAVQHDIDDTVQQCYTFVGANIASVVYDYLTFFGGLDPAFCNLDDWKEEVNNFIPFNITGVIAKPTKITKLLSELQDLFGFRIWWDEIGQQVRLVAIKAPSTGSQIISDDDWIIEGTFKVKDSIDSRVSQIWTSFGIIDYTDSADDETNYKNTLVTVDVNAESDDQYGQKAIKEVKSRYISSTGRDVAKKANDRVLSRYRDIIRRIEFAVPVYRHDQINVGDTRVINSRYLQDEFGQNDEFSALIMSIEEQNERLLIEAEEQRYIPPPDDNITYITVSDGERSINLREQHDVDNVPPTSSTQIICIIDAGATLGSNSTSEFALDIGDWSDYTYDSITVIINSSSTISGRGGDGGLGEPINDPQDNGQDGGPAIYTRTNIIVKNLGTIQGGGGGGGGGGTSISDKGAGGGGGGAGSPPGAGGAGGFALVLGEDGESGTLTSGGAGGEGDSPAGDGGAGGGPGQSGVVGQESDSGDPGAPGVAIDGVSYITFIDANGDPDPTHGTVHGAEIN